MGCTMCGPLLLCLKVCVIVFQPAIHFPDINEATYAIKNNKQKCPTGFGGFRNIFERPQPSDKNG